MNALHDLASTSPAALHELELQLDLGTPWPMQRWRNLIDGAPWHAQTVLVKDRPVGVVVVDLVSAEADQRRIGWILTLHVHPVWQEVGIGSLLLDDLIEHADRDQVILLQRVPEGDLRQMAFYERRGFEVRGDPTDSYYESGASALTLVRET